jgi:CheY-like chemotaxis protein
MAIDGGALDVAQTAQPDLILLDLMMPGMDGFEVSRRLRDDPATASIPIVVMSASERIRNPSMILAVDGRLPKPFELDELYATVARWVQGPRT